MWWSEDNSPELGLSLHSLDLCDQTPIVMFGDKGLSLITEPLPFTPNNNHLRGEINYCVATLRKIMSLFLCGVRHPNY